MHEPFTHAWESSPAVPSLAAQAQGLVAAPDRRRPGRQRERRQPMDGAGPPGRSGSPPAWPIPGCATPADRRTARPPARPLAAWGRSVWLPGRGLDPGPRGGHHSPRMRDFLPSRPCRAAAQGHPLEPAQASAACPPARRGRHCPLAPGDVARPQRGAQAQGQRLFFLDDSGFYPLPSVVRTYAPLGRTPVLQEGWTREPLSASSALSPEGKRYCLSQDHALTSEEVVACLEPRLREVPGRRGSLWDGAPMPRSQVMKECLAPGAAQRVHVDRLPAYAPELNPGEGLWAQLTGVELRKLCCVNLPHLRRELRDAVKRVRRKPRLLKGCFQGAGL